MKRSPIPRRRPLRPGGTLTRRVPLRRTPLTASGPTLVASEAQRAKVADAQCLVCAACPVDPAHLVSRALGGCDEPDCAVPLCRRCHRAFDRHELDLLPHLEPAFRKELAHAVMHLGLVGVLRRVVVSSDSVGRFGV